MTRGETSLPIEPLLTAREVAQWLGVHENYVYDRAASGQLPSHKIGGLRRFRVADVDEWLDDRREVSRRDLARSA